MALTANLQQANPALITIITEKLADFMEKRDGGEDDEIKRNDSVFTSFGEANGMMSYQ